MIPAVVLTGFLGAGKTTVLNSLLRSRPDLRIGVVENEAGEEGVDGDLLEGAARVVEIAGGCACCTVRGALVGALELMGQRTGELDLVVVEASGVADPIPIVQAFQAHEIRSRLRFTEIICVVDAAAVADTKRRPVIHDLQLRLAEHVVVTKSDLVDTERMENVKERIRSIAPEAILVTGIHEPDVLARILEGPGATVPEIVSPNESDPGHGFTAHSLRVPRDLDAKALDGWATDLLRVPGVMRLKGTVGVAGGTQRLVFQGTPQMLETYPDQNGNSRKDRLVVIGTNIELDSIQTGLDQCVARPVEVF